MKNLKLLSLNLVSLLFLVSCAAPTLKNTAVPVINTDTKEFSFIKPRKFNVTPDTRKSKVMHLIENTTDKLNEPFTKETFNMNYNEDEGGSIGIGLKPITFKEKKRTTITYGYLPLISIITNNISQDRIDQAVPKIQKRVYDSLKKDFIFLPKSSLEKLSEKPQVTYN